MVALVESLKEGKVFGANRRRQAVQLCKEAAKKLPKEGVCLRSLPEKELATFQRKLDDPKAKSHQLFSAMKALINKAVEDGEGRRILFAGKGQTLEENSV